MLEFAAFSGQLQHAYTRAACLPEQRLGGGEYKGLIIAPFTLTAGISRPFSGKLTDTVGRVPVMAVGSIVFFVAFTISSVAIRFFSGRLSDRYGRILIIEYGLAILILSMGILAWGESPYKDPLCALKASVRQRLPRRYLSI